MKYRYRVRLAKKQSEVVEVETTEEDSKAAEGENKVIYLEGVARYICRIFIRILRFFQTQQLIMFVSTGSIEVLILLVYCTTIYYKCF